MTIFYPICSCLYWVDINQVSSFETTQKSQSASSVVTVLPITYDDPEPEKKSWFSLSGDKAARIAGLTSQALAGNSAS